VLRAATHQKPLDQLTGWNKERYHHLLAPHTLSLNIKTCPHGKVATPLSADSLLLLACMRSSTLTESSTKAVYLSSEPAQAGLCVSNAVSPGVASLDASVQHSGSGVCL